MYQAHSAKTYKEEHNSREAHEVISRGVESSIYNSRFNDDVILGYLFVAVDSLNGFTRVGS